MIDLHYRVSTNWVMGSGGYELMNFVATLVAGCRFSTVVL